MDKAWTPLENGYRNAGDTDPRSPIWLGRQAFKTEIQDSALWNVQLTNGATMRAFWIAWLLAFMRLGKGRTPTQRIPRSCRISRE